VKTLTSLFICVSLLLSIAACSDDDSPTTPEPPVGNTNVLNGTMSGGAASVVAITAYLPTGAEDTDYVYEDDLTYGCDESWYPQGTLCNEEGTANDKAASTKIDEDSGAAWNNFDDNDDPLAVTGVLVVDACKDGSCESVAFSQARVFQMYSDGVTTGVRLAIHPEMGDTAPAWDDEGWVIINGGFSPVGMWATEDDGITVTSPAVIDVGSRTSRYVRIEAKNDLSVGDPEDVGDYIELRSVKLF